MGVPGLWAHLKPARKTRSLTELAVVDGFEKNKEYRGYRVGIDASLWFFHATTQYQAREGENSELRMFFFRLCKLMNAPFLPLFIFDGPHKPAIKRGKNVKGKANWMEGGVKNMIAAFGFECYKAPGEAEAELAYLNRIGYIDAVITDDVDTLLFGATTIIRNHSLGLSGNKNDAEGLKNSDGRNDGNHVYMFSSEDIAKHPETELTSDGLILVAMLSGGDYFQAGLAGCGPVISLGLARAGFGDSLCNAARVYGDHELETSFFPQWREQLITELRTNASGKLGRKAHSLANKISPDFPSTDVLRSYISPTTSGSLGRDLPTGLWRRQPNLELLAAVCELHFEWGTEKIVTQRFRRLVFPGVVTRAIRLQTMLADRVLNPRRIEMPSTPRKNKDRSMPGTPSSVVRRHFSRLALDQSQIAGVLPDRSATTDPDDALDNNPIIMNISKTRNHSSTDGILEYRLEIDPRPMVKAVKDGMRGLREEPTGGLFDEDDLDGGKKMVYEDPESTFKMWLAADMVDLVEKDLVEDWKEALIAKENKKAAKKPRKKKGQSADADSEDDAPPKKPARKTKKKLDEDADSSAPPSPTKAKGKAKAALPEPVGLIERLDNIYATSKTASKGQDKPPKKKTAESSKLPKPATKTISEHSSQKSSSSTKAFTFDDDVFGGSSLRPSAKDVIRPPDSPILTTSNKQNANPRMISEPLGSTLEGTKAGPSKLSRRPSFSDDDEDRTEQLKKSPRKKEGHTSPRHREEKHRSFKYASLSDSSSEEEDRTDLFKYLDLKQKKSKSGASAKDVISISDSDNSPVKVQSRSAVAPAPVPKKVSAQPAAASAPRPPARPAPRTIQPPIDVIEISD